MEVLLLRGLAITSIILANLVGVSTEFNVQKSTVLEETYALDADPANRDDSSNKSKLPPCNKMILDNRTLALVSHLYKIYEPNLIRFTVDFKYTNKSVYFSETPDTILPRHWIWTYYVPKGFFPYLKWPANFGLLSFGLLDTRSLPKRHEPTMELLVQDTNCSITMWDNASTYVVANALAELVPPNHPFTNYFCYIKLNPHVNETLGYRLAVHFGYPVDYVQYNCCRTQDMTISTKRIQCIDQIPKMWQVTKLPFLIGLVVFAYIPLIMFSVSGALMRPSPQNHAQFVKALSTYTGDYDRINDDDTENKDKDNDNGVIYLDGSSPIQISYLLCGLCSLYKIHPVCVSRCRRIFCILLCPIAIILGHVLYSTNNDYTRAFLEHGWPMGYMTLMAGYERGKQLFAPYLGGPHVLLCVFPIAGLVLVAAPRRLDIIFHVGTLRSCCLGEISPLLLSTETIDRLSPYSIHNSIGFTRVSMLSRCMCFMILNRQFWSHCLQIQRKRLRYVQAPGCVKILLVLLLPLYLPVCLLEMVACIVYYGIPVNNVIIMVINGYVTHGKMIVSKCFGGTKYSMPLQITRYIMAAVVVFVVAYFIFSVTTIFLASFEFLARILVFCLIAALVYPGESFGYIFFGIVFLYYIFKVWEKFANTYLNLLVDAVEICNQLEMSTYGTLSRTIKTHNVQSTIQSLPPKIQLLSERNNMSGIPEELYRVLIRKFKPVYKCVAQSVLKILLILALLVVTVSIFLVKHGKPTSTLSKTMHVVFTIGIGALPRVLEVAMDTMSHSVKKDLELRRMKDTVVQYWEERNLYVLISIDSEAEVI